MPQPPPFKQQRARWRFGDVSSLLPAGCVALAGSVFVVGLVGVSVVVVEAKKTPAAG
jgi:hypothetical protein